MYAVIDEASEEVYGFSETLEEAVEICEELPKQGKYLVLDDADNVCYDTKPGISYKI